MDHIDFSAYERILVLSPHLDDAVLSCGGLLESLRGVAPRTVITVFCADRPPGCESALLSPPSLRRREDIAAMRALDCDYVHLGFPDAVDRPAGAASIYGDGVAPTLDGETIDALAEVLARLTQRMGRRLLLSPLGVGWHIDHLLCARAVLKLDGECEVCFYEDFPYTVRYPSSAPNDHPLAAIDRLGLSPGQRLAFPFDPETKLRLLTCYGSQIPRLFGGPERLRALIESGPIEHLWTAPPARAARGAGSAEGLANQSSRREHGPSHSRRDDPQPDHDERH